MDYLVKTDLLALVDLTTLDTLIDADDTMLDQAESNAMDEMNAYLSVRHDSAAIFDSQNKISIIVMYLSDIMLYHLHARISPDNVPELRKDRYDHAKDWLEKLADGFINPPALPSKSEEVPLPIRFGNSAPKQNHFF